MKIKELALFTNPDAARYRLELAQLLDDCCDDNGWDGGDVCEALAELVADQMVNCPSCHACAAKTAERCPMCGAAMR